ncbi:hypothetical protein [Streptomyces sp. NPDC001274]
MELSAVLLTVFHTLLARHAGRGDVPVAVVADGTRDTDADVAAVVCGASGDPAFTEALTHVARGVADAAARGPVPSGATGTTVAWFAWRTADRGPTAFPPHAQITLDLVADEGGPRGVLGYGRTPGGSPRTSSAT